jgi:MYXO-CTERM domain-containing protein
VTYSETLSDLMPGTTYYYCAIASNTVGTSFGEVLTVSTGATAPSVTTSAPSDVTVDSAVLNGLVDPNGDATTAWFRYDTSHPGSCNDTFGVRAPGSGAAALGGGIDPVTFSELVSGLTPARVYYVCAIAENAFGMSFGEVVSFSPGAIAPTVTTEPAVEVGGTGATVGGTANPNGTDTTGWFRYGEFDPGACDDAFGTRAGGEALGAGMTAAGYSFVLSGLEPNLTYYYCAAASNLGGAAFGDVHTFTTTAAPPVVRTATTTIGAAGAVTLSGAANPRGTDAVAWFRYDAVDPGECSDSFGTRAPSVGGTALGAERTDVEFSQAVSDLPPGTYFACAIASNEAGESYGDVVTFVVPDAPVDGGCGCRAVSTRPSAPSMLPLVALALLAFRVRRRRKT